MSEPKPGEAPLVPNPSLVETASCCCSPGNHDCPPPVGSAVTLLDLFAGSVMSGIYVVNAQAEAEYRDSYLEMATQAYDLANVLLAERARRLGGSRG